MEQRVPEREPSLFAVGNQLFRKGDYEGSIAVYEYLSKSIPEFAQYSRSEKTARKILAKSIGQKFAHRRYHLENSDEFQRRLRVAHRISALGDEKLVKVALKETEFAERPECYLALANACSASSEELWLHYLNSYLTASGRAKVGLAESVTGQIYDRLKGSRLPQVDGPLVTVCISCWNAERHVELAVRSIMNQSYRNLEIFLFDDRSTDRTLAILKRLEGEDSRIKVIQNEVNQGTYVSRNQAFAAAKGEFFTILDADDFALPDRIEMQVRDLQQNSERLAMLTDWVRMEIDGRFFFKAAWGGKYQHEAVATLMVRTEPVKRKIGYWDSVRFGADTEFLARLRAKTGHRAAPKLDTPTVISLMHDDSLTNNPVTGIGRGELSSPFGLSPARKKYRESWGNWHETEKEAIYMPFPLFERKFNVPAEMLP